MKALHKDALLLFRVGDFYETFGEDAVRTANALNIVLTSRNNGGSDIELAGFPYHSLDLYLPKLVRAGYRVAICEQLEKPGKEKKIVKRGVTEIITPGLGTSDNLLEQKENNYLAAYIKIDENNSACALLDLSTGDFQVFEGATGQVTKLFGTYNPKEVLYPRKDKKWIDKLFTSEFYCYSLEDWTFQLDYGYGLLIGHFKVQNLKGFGIEELKQAQICAGAILHYLATAEHKNINHIQKISKIQLDRYVWLDQFTIRNLELLYPNHPSGTALHQILDHCITAMGARLLKKWIVLPLTDIKSIDKRLAIVESLLADRNISEEFTILLRAISDLERIIARIALKKANPREVLQLNISLSKIPKIVSLLSQLKSKSLNIYLESLDPMHEIRAKIDNTLVKDPPVQLHKGNVIGEKVNAELDRLRHLIRNSKSVLDELHKKEIVRTGIANLKVGFNNVFGYYFEVTNRYKDQNLIPDDWTRKQTLTNAERYISEELKQLESDILGAEEKINSLEEQIFNDLIDWLGNYTLPIQQNADIIAQLDCLNCFAIGAAKYQYTKPVIDESHDIEIIGGRHPVIEAQLSPGEFYIPNDLTVSNDGEQVLLITGPNMSGKSAILRQTALICLMAQMGSFVPAERARIGLVDRIFTRVGASDNLSGGESTFMVEMIETSSILNNLSNRSLLLLDEIGRGTSTYDGISIAWSIVEYLHEEKSRPKTLFATHYHELSQLSDKYDRIANYNVTTKELKDKIIFLRKLEKGSNNQSFGIHVAQMSGLPKIIVYRANQILKLLQEHSIENDQLKSDKLNKLEKHVGNGQMVLFGTNPKYEKLENEMKYLDINSMTPIECMLKLTALKKSITEN